MEVDQNDYFQSYEDLEIHQLMLEDKVRNQSYKKATMDNAPYIRDKIVLDVGAGTGILSIFFAQAGAAKVFAVEASNTYKIAEEIVKENGLENIIQVIHCKVEDLALPGDMKVDILASEWMGFYLLHEGMLDSVITARDKFLKTDGTMFPESATIYASPCTFPSMYSYWDNVEGIAMSSFAAHLRNKASEKPQTVLINASDVLGIPEAVFWCDLQSVTHSELDLIEMEHVFAAQKIGKYQGIALWFNCMFPSMSGMEPVTLSTDPEDEPTHWKQTTIVLPNEIQVEKDEPIAVKLQLRRGVENSRRYNIEVEMLDPEQIEHPEYCTCYMTKCILSRAVINKYEDDKRLAQ